jgi:hypothetical protein
LELVFAIYPLSHFQAVLHFMTGSSPPDGTVGISADVVQVLLVSGLMKRFTIA